MFKIASLTPSAFPLFCLTAHKTYYNISYFLSCQYKMFLFYSVKTTCSMFSDMHYITPFIYIMIERFTHVWYCCTIFIMMSVLTVALFSHSNWFKSSHAKFGSTAFTACEIYYIIVLRCTVPFIFLVCTDSTWLTMNSKSNNFSYLMAYHWSYTR